MPPPNLEQAREQLRRDIEALDRLELELDEVRTRLAAARSAGDPSAEELLTIDEKTLHQDIAAARQNLAAGRLQLLSGGSSSISAQTVALLDTELPILFLPVRVETRFAYRLPSGELTFASSSNATDVFLLLRVFPDEIHDVSHEPGLTRVEEELGLRYWRTIWRAPADPQTDMKAWAELVSRAGPRRAAWIARALEPQNLAQRPTSMPPRSTESEVPQFQHPPHHAASWSRPSRADCLPDYWTVIAYYRGQRLTKSSRLVQDPLFTGPDPAAAPAASDEQVAIDDGMRWMVDFAEAEGVGMAVRLNLGPPPAAMVDRLLVVGVRATLSPAASARGLEELIDAHHYTRGVSFLAQGTPSNNAPESRSGYDRRQEDSASESWGVERSSPLCDEQSPADGTHAARALGVRARLFAHIRRANATEQRDARDMQNALWPVTFGFWAQEMMRFSPGGMDEARRYFIQYVRARGPVPAFRVGGQPYGILPVTLSQPYEVGAGFRYQLPPILDRIRSVWVEAQARVPTVAEGLDPDQTLIDILRRHGATRAFSLRALIGRDLVNLLGGWLGGSLSDPAALGLLADIPRGLLTDLSLPWETDVTDYLFFPDSIPVTAPLVQPIDAAGDSPDYPRNYLRWLTGADGITVDRIVAEQFPGNGKPVPLLYALVRQSLLRAYDAVAVQLLSQMPGANPADWEEHELVNWGPGGPTSTPFSRLAQSYSGTTVARYIDGLDNPTTPEERALFELRASLHRLSRVPVDVLEQALTETLDLAGHRLEAWLTSVATRRLLDIRVKQGRRDGIQLGGYGWLENLRPTAGLNVVTTSVVGEDQEPLYTAASNAGFVHAPSLAHAATAAVLRSGHLAHTPSDPTAAHPLAIELTSDRVRSALHLIDGVRQGQPLGALLGYRFERALHNSGLDSLIPSFRELAPLTAHRLHETDDSAKAPVQTIAANTVVDGLQLLQRAQKAEDLSWGSKPLPTTPSISKMRELNEAFAGMTDSVDALSDLIMTESVFHAVRGNPLRAAAAADSMSGVGTLPAELEVIRSARSGVGLTHRLLVLCPPAGSGSSSWPTLLDASPRSSAEPRLDEWVGSLLGDPARIKCRAEFVDEAAGTRMAVSTSLGDAIASGQPVMQIGPLDLVYAAVPVSPGDAAQRSELEERLLEYFETTRLSRTPPPGAHAVPVLTYERDSSWGPDDLGFGEVAELASAIRELLGDARAIRPADLELPGAADSLATLDFDDLGGRTEDAMEALQSAVEVLLAARDAGTPEVVDLRQALFQLARFGVPGAAPAGSYSSEAQEIATLSARADSIQREMDRREDEWQRVTSSLTGAQNDAERLKLHLERFAVVFGREFLVIPQFAVPDSTGLASSLADTLALQGGDSNAARQWLQRVSRVRTGAGRLRAVLSYADALASASAGWSGGLPLQVVQLPYTAGDRWVGLPLPSGSPLSGGRLSLVIGGAGSPAWSNVAGLLVDEWVEVVPGRSETTALSFHYDAPGAVAPQAMLLAVPPPALTAWDEASLEGMVTEGLAIAKLRAVDSQALDRVGHFLPAVFLAHNVQDETITMDVMRLVNP